MDDDGRRYDPIPESFLGGCGLRYNTKTGLVKWLLTQQKVQTISNLQDNE
jgi:hypothetical protein